MRRSFIRSLSAMSIFFAVVFPVSLPGQNQGPGVQVISPPREGRLQRAHSFDGDLRSLPQMPAEKLAGPEFNTPALNPVPYPGAASPTQRSSTAATALPVSGHPAPPAGKSFEGLDFTTWGAAHSGGASGDVGAQYYIQTINAAVGVYDKSDGSRVAAFTIHALMSQGDFGNPCDGANLGDPAVLYDTFEQRWILVDFAFGVSGGYFAAPAFQCFAVSRSGDPVGGGWNFYSIAVSGGIGDAPRIGIWPDGLYMSANIFSVGAAAFQNARAWAFNKAQMYAGNPTVQALWFDVPSPASTLLPGNARLQTGTPAAGSPDYFTAVGQFLNAVSVYKLHADWDNLFASTFSGPFVSLTATSWSKLSVPTRLIRRRALSSMCSIPGPQERAHQHRRSRSALEFAYGGRRWRKFRPVRRRLLSGQRNRRDSRGQSDTGSLIARMLRSGSCSAWRWTEPAAWRWATARPAPA